MSLIEMTGVIKDYPLGQTTVHALKGVDLRVEMGDFLSIIGPSGSGKTTLLNIIGCIDTPTKGEVLIGDKRVSTSSTPQNGDGVHMTRSPNGLFILNDTQLTNLRLFKIGFIFQTFNLIPVLNIRENVEFPLLLMKKFTKEEINQRAEKLIKEVGLMEYIDHKPAELSGGQRQRVAIARALVTQPDIILADEPTANLDSETSEQILALMRELNEIEKTTFIFSTHDPEVIKYAKRVVKIKDGKIEK